MVAAGAGALLLLCASPRAQIVGEDRAAADAAFLERRYGDSAEAYTRVVRTERNDGEAWFRLGFSLHATKKYADSIPAYRRAIELKYAPLMSYYNIACAYALVGDRERALAGLEDAVSRGYNTSDQIEQDADLASVRDDPRYSAAVRRSKEPMSAFPEARGADVLFGLWAIESEVGRVGTLTGNVSAKGFAFHLECYDDSGRVIYLLLTFAAKEREWRVAGADRDGGIYEGAASFTEEAMVCNGRRPGGGKSRATVRIEGPGEARLTMETLEKGSWKAVRSYRAESSRAIGRINGGR